MTCISKETVRKRWTAILYTAQALARPRGLFHVWNTVTDRLLGGEEGSRGLDVVDGGGGAKPVAEQGANAPKKWTKRDVRGRDARQVIEKVWIRYKKKNERGPLVLKHNSKN